MSKLVRNAKNFGVVGQKSLISKFSESLINLKIGKLIVRVPDSDSNVMRELLARHEDGLEIGKNLDF